MLLPLKPQNESAKTGKKGKWKFNYPKKKSLFFPFQLIMEELNPWFQWPFNYCFK